MPRGKTYEKRQTCTIRVTKKDTTTIEKTILYFEKKLKRKVFKNEALLFAAELVANLYDESDRGYQVHNKPTTDELAEQAPPISPEQEKPRV